MQNGEFIIKTDQRSLVHLEDQRLSTPWQKKAFSKLLGLRYKIVYRKGRDNVIADALSRQVHDQQETVAALTVCQPVWLEEVIASYQQDSKAQQLLSSLSVDANAKPQFQLDKGIIRYQGRIWLGSDKGLQMKIFKAFHSSALGGHSGAPVTYKRIKQLFFWQGMKKEVKAWVQSCQICQQAKPERIKYPGLLKPLPVPFRPWQHIAMDFVEGLPQSGKYNCLMIVIDRFSRYGHFIPLAHPYTAAKVAKLFVDNVFKLHSLPESIVSDRDPVFTSKFWQEFFRAVGTELKMSTAYHPATDGSSERLNQCVETYLRCFVHSCPKKWSDWISMTEYWYNTSPHSTLKKSPFVVLYSHEPRHWGIEPSGECSVSNLESWLAERRVMHDLLRQHLLRAQQFMKKYADKNRSFREFSVGDMVFLKLQPYIHSSIAPRANHKLLFKYYGPFQVLARISEVAYRINLPQRSTVHPVFHVSLLRKALAPGMTASEVLPIDTDVLAIPSKILGTRWRKKSNKTIEQVLVEWSPGTAASATWEDRQHLQDRFPAAPAWGQAGSQEGRDVREPYEASKQATTSEHSSDETEEEAGTSDAAIRPSRPHRQHRPNKKYQGPDWC